MVSKEIKTSLKLGTRAFLLVPEKPNKQPGWEIGVKDLVENYARELLGYNTISFFLYNEVIEVVKNKEKEGDWRIVGASYTDTGRFLELIIKDSKEFDGIRVLFSEGNWLSELVANPVSSEYIREKRKSGVAMINLEALSVGVMRRVEGIKWKIPETTSGIRNMCQSLVEAIHKQVEEAKSFSKEGSVIWTKEGKSPIIRMKEVNLHYKSLEDDYRSVIRRIEDWLSRDLERAIARSFSESGSEPARKDWSVNEIIITISGPPKQGHLEAGEQDVTSIYIEKARVGKNDSLAYVFFVPVVKQANEKELRLDKIWLNVVVLLGSNIEVDEDKSLIYSITRNLGKHANNSQYLGLQARSIIYPNIDKMGEEERLSYLGVRESIENFYSQANFSSYYKHRWSLKYKGGNLFSYEKSVIRTEDEGNLYVSNVESDFARAVPMVKHYLKRAIFPNQGHSPLDRRSTVRVGTGASKEKVSISDLVLFVNSGQLGELAKGLIEILEKSKRNLGEEKDKEEETRVKVLGGERIAQSILNYLGEVGSVPELCPPGEGKPLRFYEGNNQGVALEPLGWYEIIKSALESGEAVFHIGPNSFDAISVREYSFVEDQERGKKEALIRFLVSLEKSEVERAIEDMELSMRIETERFVELEESGRWEYKALPEKLAIKSANLGIKVESEDEKWVLAIWI